MAVHIDGEEHIVTNGRSRVYRSEGWPSRQGKALLCANMRKNKKPAKAGFFVVQTRRSLHLVD
ncbi:hypothetical protein ACK3YF_14910 [Aeromonas allosaccharophila]|uniref:hypothetical protein n=1 Tax=Aeromonas allosaccharophila TaxID=656 RepID=UPI003987CA33